MEIFPKVVDELSRLCQHGRQIITKVNGLPALAGSSFTFPARPILLFLQFVGRTFFLAELELLGLLTNYY